MRREILLIVLMMVCMTKSGFTFDAPDVLSVKVKQAPIVDGQLNDDCWKSATHLSGFYRIDSPEKIASFKTDVYICYDEQNIYIIFACQDSNPQKIQAIETKRGGSFSTDDHVTALIAPNYQQSAYKFQVNALGTQSEEIPGGSAIKTEWRGDWEAQVRINEQSWTAELKIPFSILRHSHEQTIFGLAFSRYVARLKETSAWPVGNLDPQMQAKWTNLSLSSSKGTLKIMPYLLAELGKESNQLSAGGDLKYLTASGMTTVLTVHPDFQTIEDEVLGLDFSYTERYLPDYRPFFSEGGGFLPPDFAFYSRRIETVDFGAKAFGSIGKTHFAFLDTIDRSKNNNFAAKISPTFDVADGQVELGLSFVNHLLEEQANSVVGSYVGYQRTTARGAIYANATLFGSQTSGNNKDGQTYSISVGRWVNAGTSGFLFYRAIQEDYHPSLGFVPEKDLRGPHLALFYNSPKGERFLESWSWAINLQNFSRYNGELYHRTIDVGASISILNGPDFNLSAMWSNRSPNIDRLLNFSLSWQRDSKSWDGGLYTSVGKFSGADYYLVGINQTIQPMKPLIAEIDLQHRRMNFPQKEVDRVIQVIGSFNYNLSGERGIGGRIIYNNEEGKLNAYVTFRQNVRKGLDAYLIIGEPNASEFVKSIAFKSIYVF